MKRTLSLLTAIIVVVAIVCFGTLPSLTSTRSEAVAFIIDRFECLVDELTTQIFCDEVIVDEPEELPVIEEIPVTVTDPQEENDNGKCTFYIYGESEMGQALEAYIINGYGENDKVIFMDFAVHGFEDEYANDGQVLVDLGQRLVEYYAEHPEALGDYKMVIVPCANPDGVVYGVNDLRADKEGAFGRCTYAGVDINRDFKAGDFKAVESRALKKLMDEYPPSVYINFHGWENSVLGDPDLIRILVPGLDLSRGKPDWYRVDDGFIMGFVKQYYGAKSALVEFKNSYSVNDALVIDALNEIMLNIR